MPGPKCRRVPGLFGTANGAPRHEPTAGTLLDNQSRGWSSRVEFGVWDFFGHLGMVIGDLARAGHLATRAPDPSVSPDRGRGLPQSKSPLPPCSTGRADRRGFAPKRDRARRLVRRPAAAAAD